MDKSNVSILLAEDEPTLRLIFEKQLKQLGYNMLEKVENGLLAVEKAKSNRYQLIFLDVNMPELNGLLAAERIRLEEQKEDGLRTPIVALTALDVQQECLLSGMDDFLRKPIFLADLQRTIDKWTK
jgi:two-component system, sensor histidine kinase and response regulator